MGHVLIVEAQPSVRLSVRRFLEQSGGHTCTALGGRPTVPESPETYDIALVDYRSLGSDATDRLRHLLPGMPLRRVIITSRSEDWGDALRMLEEGFFACLPKPLDFDKLDALVRRCFAGEPVATVAVKPLSDPPAPGELLYRSAAMEDVLQRIELVAPHDITVLITGESGTGKELVARAIHHRSPRRGAPFEAIHCGAIPTELLESELFGHERGSFTDAHKTKIGRFEAAGAGTIFLDEIAEMPPQLQVKLLRVLQEKEIQRVGGLTPIPVRARIVAATHRDLQEWVARGRFRIDLLHRLQVATVHLPPLRERIEDIELLAAVFLGRFADQFGKSIQGLSQPALERLNAHAWPGNVRELENLLQRAVVLSQGSVVGVDDLTELAGVTTAVPEREETGSWEKPLGQHITERLAAGEEATELARELAETVQKLVQRSIAELPPPADSPEGSPE